MDKSKIYSIFKKRNQIYLYNTYRTDGYDETLPSTQWISDGLAMYPLYGLPQFNEDTIKNLLGIPDNKQDGAFVTICDMPYPDILESFNEYDTDLKLLQFSINEMSLLMPNEKNAEPECFFVRGKYIKPVCSSDEITFTYRRKYNCDWILVHEGMIIHAVLIPLKFSAGNASTVTLLDALHKAAYEIERQFKEEEDK